MWVCVYVCVSAGTNNVSAVAVHWMSDSGVRVSQQVFPASTDSRFLREAGINAYGFSPMPNTPVLLHDHNEFLNRSVFLQGIDVYERLLHDLVHVHTRRGDAATR